MESFAKIERLSQKYFGKKPREIKKLSSSGSARRYFRIFFKNEETSIYCESENIKENETFISLARYLHSRGLPVPDIIGINEDYSGYFLEDLGDTDLFGLIRERTNLKNTSSYDTINQFEERFQNTIEAVITCLVKFQTLNREEWDNIIGFPPFSRDLISFDLNYALDNIFSPLKVEYNEAKLENEFQLISQRLMSYPSVLWGLMYRDFQSRNIMLHPGPYLIDFQSARFGPGIYDLVSFAWQAKAGFSDEDREHIINVYCKRLTDVKGNKSGLSSLEAEEKIKGEVKYWALFRIMQTLGAYGLRGIKEGKPHFIESLPYAVNNLQKLLSTSKLNQELPELTAAVEKLHTFL